LRYTFESSSSSSSSQPLLTVTISRPPLSLDEPMLFSWLRYVPEREVVGRKRKKKAASAWHIHC
jgi:hypothetical protein